MCSALLASASLVSLVSLAALAGCPARAATPAPAVPAPAAAAQPAPPPRPGPATHVVVLEPGVPAAVVAGPFLVHTINPGGDLHLGLSKTGTCEDATWFSYSGGGAAAATGETLCARSRAGETVTHGFSGTD